MASIEKRGNGSWRVTLSSGYDAKGKKKFIKRTITVDPHKTENAQRKIVEKEAALLEADLERQQITDARKLTFEEVYNDYIEDRIVRKGLVQQTVDSYKKLFKQRLLPEFGRKAVRDITAHDLNVFFRRFVKEELSGTYSRKYYQQLNALFKYAQRSGIIVTNPCTLIEPPHVDTQEAQFYEKEEIPAILEAIRNHPDPEWCCYFILSFYCGARPEEITGLNWSDYDGSQLSITAGAYQPKGERCKRTEKPKTKKSNRKIMLTEDAILALNTWKKVQLAQRLKLGGGWADPEAVFTNDLGERIRIQMPSKKWRDFTKSNGIRHLPLYDLRHTNCSLLISTRELSVEEVAARMGHSQTSTTLNIYSHCFNDGNKRATEALVNYLKKCE